MAQPSDFSTSNITGVDPTTYYAVSASLTPETPAPPFQVGTLVQANDGSEYLFVQASTSVSLGDFLAVTNAQTANSLTSTNVQSSLGARLGMASATLAQSVTYVPAGAYFWAQLRGASCPGNAGTATTVGLGANIQLFTSASAGVVTSVTTSSSLAAGLAGIQCVSSTTPLFQLTWPRAVAVFSSAGGTLTVIANS